MDLKSIVAQYLREAAADYLNMSTRTFDRYIEKGELSQGVHVRGSKNLIWYKDELVK